MMKKYLAEFIGTFTLVFFGCGTAVVLGGVTGGTDFGTLGVISIALAFGLAIVASAYAIGPVSGCHVNPAVSLAMLVNGRMSFMDFIGYVVAQIAGAFAGSGLLYAVSRMTDLLMDGTGLGQNGYDYESYMGISMVGALVVEVVLTFIFVLTVLGVTASAKTANVAGIVIGLTLTFVHIIGIPLTGTSVNPARSLAPAVLVGEDALSQVWVFIVAPLVGALLAALAYRFLFSVKEKAKVDEVKTTVEVIDIEVK
ncbi:MIP family channel protein [Ruminococcaceae bacterium OttesenSCG-928-D13]|nr:MIP family channel protein [Ruminococcaceae bacterium OttesenSCG-928-D13]